MILAAGTRLGPYEILSAIGAGGMGEVYKARDTRLDRIVAIKVLPAQLSSDPDFRDRFDREARAISALDHPHICALYDLGEQDGTSFLVMQYLEGDTLQDHLAKGALSLDQALQYAIQIADALVAAHRAGIVHRDLKPGNVMLTKSGAKLLDFGLAKASAPVVAGPSLSMLPTTPPNLTAQGTILGTFQYMAPEQLEGQEADARTDIFAFGAVVFEMLTGKKAFEGKSQASLIAAILKVEPLSISTAQPLTPRALDRAVKKCLAKEPGERWQSAKDLYDELKWIAIAHSEPVTSSQASPGQRAHRLTWLAWGAAALFLGTTLLVSAVRFREQLPEATTVRFQIPLPEKTYLPPTDRALALSPDGRSMVFTAAGEDGRPRLWIRALDSLEARSLPGTDGVYGIPFWSPDSRFVAFGTPARLMKIDVTGGPPQPLCDAAFVNGGTWNRDGTIVFGTTRSRSGFRVHQSGGLATPIALLDARTGFSRPEFLPDGNHVIYRGGNSSAGFGIYLTTLDGKQQKRLVATTSAAHYAPPSAGGKPGHLLFLRDTTLMAQPLDPKSFDLAGDAFPAAAEEVGAFSVSPGGALAYLTGPTQSVARPVWFDRNGTVLRTLGPPGRYSSLALSPDGTRVAVDRTVNLNGNNLNRDIWLMDATSGVSGKLTFDPGAQHYVPVWSPNGSRLAFTYWRDGVYNIYWKDSRGVGNADPVLNAGSSGQRYPEDWSSDGKYLLYAERNPNGIFDLLKLPLDPAAIRGDRRPSLYLPSQFDETHAQFSPGSARWVANASNLSGQREIYVHSFPDGATKFQVSDGGGTEPRWRRDGQELFYISADSKLMAVDVRTTPTFEHGVPKALFQTRIHLGDTLNFTAYDVAPDGQKFLIISEDPAEQAARELITVVLNWTAGLKK